MMDVEEALRWVDKNCSDSATLDRLRSRRVAKTLADELKRLRKGEFVCQNAGFVKGETSMLQRYQLHALRRWKKEMPNHHDMERVAKAEEKRARKNAKRMRQKSTFVFLSGEANPMDLDASDRRFMVVIDDVESLNAELTGAERQGKEK